MWSKLVGIPIDYVSFPMLVKTKISPLKAPSELIDMIQAASVSVTGSGKAVWLTSRSFTTAGDIQPTVIPNWKNVKFAAKEPVSFHY